MRIAITGATGLVGSALAPFLTTQGHAVVSFSRSEVPERIGKWARWDPAQQEIDRAALAGVEAVIHLAGENLAARRWTAARKHAIVASRVEVTHWLVEELGRLDPPPRIFLCASAVGFYGDTGDNLVDESAPAGAGFLASLCAAWESEAGRAERWGARVIHLRTGVVLTPSGGALAKLLPVFRAGLGGRIGSGRQWMSWIALDDVLGAIACALGDEAMCGPVNLVAPEPVTNAEFTRTLAHVLHRPAVLPVPATALRLLIGEMADAALLSSSRVRPARLTAAEYVFCRADLTEALQHVLGRL